MFARSGLSNEVYGQRIFCPFLGIYEFSHFFPFK